ncbi:MAG: hypothetical protein EAZ55_13000 [Cytophagales bacterium]|nr:MAG: hypothetical protein EAZ55_13000 [Cytophagales bacterium]
MTLATLYTPYIPLLQEFGIQDPQSIAQYWQQPHRFYHNENHLLQLIQDIEQIKKSQNINESDAKALLMTAFFHDLIYDPTRQDNEEASADAFEQMTQPHALKSTIKQMILDTKYHQTQNPLSQQFCDLDMRIVTHSDYNTLLEWEEKIFKEYQYIDYTYYKVARINILRKIAEQYPQNSTNLHNLIAYVEKFRPKIGIYAGSFNPFHYGHLNILEKAEKIFDKVIVARGINPNKEDINTQHLQTQVLKYRQAENFIGFLTEYIKTKETYADITLIRGLRNGDDLDYEVNQLRFMEEMKDPLNVIFIVCDKQYEHISSSAIKNLEKIDKNFSKKYVPE